MSFERNSLEYERLQELSRWNAFKEEKTSGALSNQNTAYPSNKEQQPTNDTQNALTDWQMPAKTTTDKDLQRMSEQTSEFAGVQ